MKRTNKYLSLALAIIMALSLCVTSFAGTITVNNAVDGQTYKAYKIFDVTVIDGAGTEQGATGYAYKIEQGSAWWNDVLAYMNVTEPDTHGDYEGNGLKLTKTTDGNWFNVTQVDDGLNAEAFAAFLNDRKDGKEYVDAEAEDNVATLEVEGAGYYFVDSSLGSLCALLTDNENFHAIEKNEEPTIEKEVDKIDNAYDEEITFTVTVTAGGAADTTYVVHDTMDEELVLHEDSFVIKMNDVEVPAINPLTDVRNYEIVLNPTDDCTFEITFNQEYTNTLANGDEIVITYDAHLDQAADSDTNYENVAVLQYGNTETTPASVYVKTFEFDLVKTTNDNVVLPGAQFNLYAADGTLIKFVMDGDVYEVAEDGTVEVINAGVVTIRGLANGVYELEETVAPDGYNKLPNRVEVTINNANDNATVTEDVYEDGGVQVINQSGALLPSTGGVGTTMFYVLGSVMMIGAAVLLVTKKKMTNEQ